MLLSSASADLLCAQEQSSETSPSDKPWTRIGLYGYLVSIDGDVDFRGLDADIDVSLHDILDNLDSTFMGFVEHRRGPWSFIFDAVYLKLSESGDTSISGPLGLGQATISAEVEFKQTLLEGFIGYRALDYDLERGRIGVDALAGARYNRLDVELSSDVSVFGLTASGDRERDEDWVDGVLATRAVYRSNAGWSLSGWADFGLGDDSHSYQLASFLNYNFDNGLTLSGGYRYYHLKYETGSGSSRFEYDLDYHGPMVGLTFTF